MTHRDGIEDVGLASAPDAVTQGIHRPDLGSSPALTIFELVVRGAQQPDQAEWLALIQLRPREREHVGDEIRYLIRVVDHALDVVSNTSPILFEDPLEGCDALRLPRLLSNPHVRIVLHQGRASCQSNVPTSGTRSVRA